VITFYLTLDAILIWLIVYFICQFLLTVRFPSDATVAMVQRKPFDSVQMAASSKFVCTCLMMTKK